MTIVYLVAGWLAGIAAARAFGEAVVWWVWLLMGVVAAAAAILLRSRDERAALLAGSTALFLLGGMAYTLATPEFVPEDVAAYNDEGRVALTGRIVAMPDVRDTHVNLRVRAETLEPEGDDRHNVNGLVLVQAPRGTDYAYGDMVRVLGELNTPPAFDTFSYRDYLARENVYSLMQYTFVEVTEEGGGNPVRRALIGVRQHADRTITRLLPDPAASLLSGILLGIETGISQDVREAFNAVSATHVIAISVSNLVVLAGVIDAVSRRFVPGRTAAVLTIGGVIGYAIFVGADAAVIRAAIMVTLYILANLLGRETFGLASLAFAAFLMTALNPLTLWDVGFQLSFLATLGLMLYVAPMQAGLEQILTNLIDAERAREIVGGLSDMLLVTIAALISTTPIMAYHFGRFSIAAFPVNLLIVPVQGPLMILGGIGVLLAMIVFPLG
ncbi:MAG: ComEC/Rec2 family competence protein, partial [Anaerolineae bacterium]